MRRARWVPGLAAAIFFALRASRLLGPTDPEAPVRGVPGPAIEPRTVDVAALPDVPAGYCPPEELRNLERGPEPHVPRGLPVPPGARILLESPERAARPRLVPPGAEAASAAAAEAAATPELDISFQGLPDNGVSFPPDTNGAVGVSQVVTMLNTQLRVQDRAGNASKTVTIGSFWGSNTTAFLSDPRLLYSAATGHWFAVMLSGRVSPAGTTTPDFLVGVSKTEDAGGEWSIYTVPVGTVAEGYSGDFPTVGYSKSRFVVQLNLYDRLFGNFLGSRIFVFDRAALEGGTLASPTQITTTEFGSTQVPSVAADPGEDRVYMLEDWNGNDPSGGLVRLFQITGPPGSEMLTPIAFFGTPDRWLDFTPQDNFAPQSGSTTNIATNGGDIGSSVVFRNGFLWAAHTIFLPAENPTRSAVQWWQVQTDGTVAQRGRIDDPTGKFFYAFPSIAVNRDNGLVVGCSRYAADRFAGAVYAYRAAADPDGTIRTEASLKDGEAVYVKQSGGTDDRNRWGDYSAAVADPVDDGGFWTVQEYAASSAGLGSLWSTWWGHLYGEPPLMPVARFDVSAAPPTVNVPVRFQDGSSGGPISWEWTFGDGTTSAMRDPQKPFAQPGKYKVSLKVSNRAGSSTTSLTIDVAPEAGRTAPRRVPPRTETPREVERPH